jgi:membrane-bound serine protease (ClpP class)
MNRATKLNCPIDRGPSAPGTTLSARVRRQASLAARMVALLFAMLLAGSSGEIRGQQPQERPVILLDIKGAIGFVTAAQLASAVEQATTQRARAIVVRIDTPGGLLSSTREMIHTILASPVPIVMYVAPSGSRAASAGTYLTYASHIAAMAPGTHLGAATPIALTTPGLPGSPAPKPSGTDKQPEPDPSARKSVNDAVAYIRSLAELRGRNADWAEKAVTEAATLTATAALKERVIDVLSDDVGDLLAQIDGRSVTTAAGQIKLEVKGARLVEIKPNWKMQVMSVIADPNIALILLMIGIYGILFEFWSPGAIVPGVVGGISLLMALTALSVLPVNYAGFALLLFGIALMMAEAFMPGFGIAGLGGIAAFAVGALFLFDPDQSDIPIAVAWEVVAGAVLLSAAFFAGVLGLAVSARRQPVRTGAEAIIGAVGEIVSWTDNHGHVRLRGEVWAARSSLAYTPGESVRVVGREGLTLVIEPVT